MQYKLVIHVVINSEKIVVLVDKKTEVHGNALKAIIAKATPRKDACESRAAAGIEKGKLTDEDDESSTQDELDNFDDSCLGNSPNLSSKELQLPLNH